MTADYTINTVPDPTHDTIATKISIVPHTSPGIEHSNDSKILVITTPIENKNVSRGNF